MLGKIHSIETMGALDGPGLRFIVFMQGCPLRCVYCHNPDTWNYSMGSEIESDEVVKKAKRFAPYFKQRGGVTLSGGDPLLQSEFCLEVFKKLKENKIHTALDTSGCIFNENVKKLLDYTDLIILDIKHTDALKFKEITGYEIDNTMALLEYADKRNISLWIRQVIVPGINNTRDDIIKLGNLIKAYKSIERIELLPYHSMGVKKWTELGLDYKLGNIVEPTQEEMDSLKEVLRNMGLKVY